MCPILSHPSKKHLAYFQYKGSPQLIFYSQEGVVTEILEKSFQLIDTMLSHYSKVTAVMVQLHQAQSTKSNKLLATMIQKLKCYLRKHYQCHVGYFWVREQKKAESQHYHMIIFLNGHKCQQSQLVDKLVNDVWTSIHPDNFRFKPRNRIYRVRRNENEKELRALRMRMSYMAKREGKDNFSSHTNSYSYSRLETQNDHN